MTQSEHPYYPFMLQAARLAELSRGDACPNPVVGALLVKDGRIMAQGRHRFFGGPHAEIEALNMAARLGVNPAECTLVVTLEPCTHQGKTPPCCQAVLKAGIKHVIIGAMDPTEQAGGGAAFLRSRGLHVETGIARELCERQLMEFIFLRKSTLPFVSLKLAATLDGAIATREGESRWITGPLARERVRELRMSAQGIMVGGNTFRHDNPQLLIRPPLTPKELKSAASEPYSPCAAPINFLPGFMPDTEEREDVTNCLAAARGLDFFPGAGRRAFSVAEDRTQPLALVATGQLPDKDANFYLLRERAKQAVFITDAESAAGRAADALRALGAGVIGPPEDLSPGLSTEERLVATMNHNLAALRKDFGCRRILCEGGGRLALFLLRHGFAQELELHAAPLVMGDEQAVRVFSGLNPENLSQALRLKLLQRGILGEDTATLYSC